MSTPPLTDIISKVYQGTVDPAVQITYEGIEQHWAQYQSLGDPKSDRTPLWKWIFITNLWNILDQFYDSDL